VVRLADPRGGRGWARGLVPAVTPGGAVGSSRVTPPPPVGLSGLAARTVTITPRTDVAAALARAFVDRAGRRRG